MVPPCPPSFSRVCILRARGRSSVGRALASQARCRGFESHRPLRSIAGDSRLHASPDAPSVASSSPKCAENASRRALASSVLVESSCSKTRSSIVTLVPANLAPSIGGMSGDPARLRGIPAIRRGCSGRHPRYTAGRQPVQGVAATVAVAERVGPSVSVTCDECGGTFTLSVRREFEHRRNGTTPRCRECRRPR